MREKHEAATAGTVTYTEIGPSIENPDGSLEHSAPVVRSNAPAEKRLEDDEPSFLEQMSPQQRLQALRNYGIQARAARIFYGHDEWRNALDADVKLPAAAVAAITQLDLPNGPQVAHYLARIDR